VATTTGITLNVADFLEKLRCQLARLGVAALHRFVSGALDLARRRTPKAGEG
jgi:hypothetical protein